MKPTPSYDAAANIIVNALALAAISHHWHLMTKSYAQHVTLGDLYLYCHEIADTLTEKLIGAGAEFPDSGGKLTFALSPPSRAIPELEAFTKSFNDITEPPWLANIAQEIQGSLNNTLYKLKRLS